MHMPFLLCSCLVSNLLVFSKIYVQLLLVRNPLHYSFISDKWFFRSIILSNPDPLKRQWLTTTIIGTNPLLIATLKNRSKQTHADMHSRAPEDNTSTISDDEIGFRPNFWTKKERIHSSVTAHVVRGEPKRKKKKKAGSAFRRGSLRNLAQSGKGKGKD